MNLPHYMREVLVRKEYTATLMTRLQTIQEGIQGKFFSKTEYTSIDKYIDSMLGETQIVDIDISMLDDVSEEVVTKVEREQVAKVTGTNKDDSATRGPKRRESEKVYPNDPCPCGSGKKYKQCCGRK